MGSGEQEQIRPGLDPFLLPICQLQIGPSSLVLTPGIPSLELLGALNWVLSPPKVGWELRVEWAGAL